MKSKKRAFRPKKSLGQRFLIRGAIVNRMISKSGFTESDTILEIGPGFGALTIPLARKVGHVLAIEKDRDLMDILAKKLGDLNISNVSLLYEDILKLDLGSLTPFFKGKINIIGNLPYNISSPVLEKLMANKEIMGKAVFMFQREFAERLIAQPGGKTYGAITVLLRYNAETVPLLNVPREAFRPKPKVDSMVVSINFQRPYPDHPVSERQLQRVVKAAFSQRRKTLLNAISSVGEFHDKGKVLKACECCGIDPQRRAETLAMEEFLCLASTLI